MATKLDKAKKKGRSSEWTKTGSFMHKPDKGWIHPDGQLQQDAGICYGVRVRTYYMSSGFSKARKETEVVC